MQSKSDFQKFAQSKCGIRGSVLDDYKSQLIVPKMDFVNPTIIEERQLNVAQMDVFSRLMMDRIIFLNGEINGDVSSIITSQLLYLSTTDPEKDISIYLNTPGGSVYDGLAIYDTMQYIPNDVQTICTGWAASMGSVLLCGGTADKRFALPHSRVMIHQPLGGMSGQATDMEINCREILKLKDELFTIIADHSGQPKEKVMADGDRDYWMTAQEALDYGMIDGILTK